MKTNPADLDIAFMAIQFISTRYRVSLEDIESHCRKWSVVWPRWLAMRLIRTHTRLGWEKIGLLFDRQQYNVRHAISALRDQTETSPEHHAEYLGLMADFNALLAHPDSRRHSL